MVDPRWPLTIYVCENCGKPDQEHGDSCVCEWPKFLRSVEVVPADRLQGGQT
jgi:hypothetical protein